MKKTAQIIFLLLFVFQVLFFQIAHVKAIDLGVTGDVFIGINHMLSGCDFSGQLVEDRDPDRFCPDETKEIEIDRGSWTYGQGKEIRRGAYHVTSNAIASLYRNQPASGQEYIAYTLYQINPNLVPAAYAQGVGVGFASLSPFLSVWRAFRNIAYFFFVIAFMVVGFAIMFRAKLNAQTVVNIEMALPSLVVTLILITFSYAIAGLMIDIMYLAIYLLVGVVTTSILPDSEIVTNLAFNRNVIQNFLVFLGGNDGAVGGLSVAQVIADMVYEMLGGENNPLQGVIAVIPAWGGGILFGLIFSVIILITAFRVFFILLTSYIQILLLVITAPLRLLMGIYPGSNAFTSWLKELAGHLSVFPALIGMFFLAYALMGLAGSEIGVTYGEAGFVPPQLGFGSESVKGIIAIGIFLTIPQLLDQVKKVFGVDEKSGGAFGGAMLGGALGSVLGPMATPFKAAGGLYKNYAQGRFFANVGKEPNLGSALMATGRDMLRPWNAISYERIKDSAKARLGQDRFYKSYADGDNDTQPPPTNTRTTTNTTVNSSTSQSSGKFTNDGDVV